jgi:hypothetical protein
VRADPEGGGAGRRDVSGHAVHCAVDRAGKSLYDNNDLIHTTTGDTLHA